MRTGEEKVTDVNNDTVTFFFLNGKTLFYWPLPRMLYRLCKNIYRLHVVFVFLTSFPIYNYNRRQIKH